MIQNIINYLLVQSVEQLKYMLGMINYMKGFFHLNRGGKEWTTLKSYHSSTTW